MTTRAAAIANDPIADEAAQDFLASGGSAVGAVLTGFFAAGGAFAGVLLGPVSILVGGVGVGARAFDGRLRQPGLGTKRPRGFKEGEEVPDSARVAIPTGVAAALVAHAYDGSQRLGTILKPGISRAQRSGADARAGLLKRIRSAGAGALTEAAFVRPVLRIAGPSQGGLVTPSDFGSVPDIDQDADERKLGAGSLVEPPWAEEGKGVVEDAEALGIGCAVCAIDVRGVFAALCYRRVSDGLPIDDLDLEAPLAAVPVQRGVTRVAPGARIPAPAPIAIRRDKSGTSLAVIAGPMLYRLDDPTQAKPLLVVKRDPRTQATEASRS